MKILSTFFKNFLCQPVPIFVPFFSFPQTFFMHEFSSVFEGFHLQLRCHATVNILQLFSVLTHAHSTKMNWKKNTFFIYFPDQEVSTDCFVLVWNWRNHRKVTIGKSFYCRWKTLHGLKILKIQK